MKEESPRKHKEYTEEEKSLPLIEFDSTGQKLIINEDSLRFIRSIKEEILVVSIIGKARTGKSFLMNLLLDNVKSGVLFFINSSSLWGRQFILAQRVYGFGAVVDGIMKGLKKSSL